MISVGIMGPHYGCFAANVSATDVRPWPRECDIPAWLWSDNERLDRAYRIATDAAEDVDE